ncbi:MAG: hypothetical protein IPM46_01910 [Flavobacteriales bacterium]|nr:hypothetical protein [Flavobacteriales bacterium]
MGRLILFLFLSFALMLAPSEIFAQGCAMCKAVAQGEGTGVFGGEQSIGRGLNRGILYLMAVPYALLFLLFRKRIVGFFKEFAGAQG